MRCITIALVSGALIPTLIEAKESICLKSGFCLEATSHMITGSSMVLETGSGTLEFPVDQIDRIVPVEDSPALSERVQSSRVAVSVSEEMLFKAAIEQGLEPGFVASVARIESGLHQEAISPRGALGLMQLTPATASRLGVDPTQAAANAHGGAMFLRELLLRYNGDAVLALAAYNAGPGAVDKYKGVPPYEETRKYVVKVLQEYARQQKQAATASQQAERSSSPSSYAVAGK